MELPTKRITSHITKAGSFSFPPVANDSLLLLHGHAFLPPAEAHRKEVQLSPHWSRHPRPAHPPSVACSCSLGWRQGSSSK